MILFEYLRYKSWTAAYVILLLILFAGASNQKFWKCSGPETEYTARDCEVDKKKMTSDLCYFLPHFQQYRPCSGICNSVMFGSVDEDRCRAYCSGRWNRNISLALAARKLFKNIKLTPIHNIILGYLNSYCRLNSPRLQKVKRSTLKRFYSSSSTAAIFITPSATNGSQQDSHMLLLIVLTSVLLSLVILMITALTCLIRRQGSLLKQKPLRPVWMLATRMYSWKSQLCNNFIKITA